MRALFCHGVLPPRGVVEKGERTVTSAFQSLPVLSFFYARALPRTAPACFFTQPVPAACPKALRAIPKEIRVAACFPSPNGLDRVFFYVLSHKN